MSQQEFDQMDEQVMGLVNEAATPEAAARAEEIAKNLGQTEDHARHRESDQKDYKSAIFTIQQEKFDALWEKAARWRRRRAVITVVLCVAIVAVLLTVMAEPELLIWLVNAGVVSCAITAGITVDRQIRSRENDDEI